MFNLTFMFNTKMYILIMSKTVASTEYEVARVYSMGPKM